MKTFRFFAFAAMAVILPLASCTEDNTGNGEEVGRGDKACRIESFVLNLGEGQTLRGDVYDYDRSIDLAYETTQLDLMQSATATVKLSDGATIAPDPSVAADYTQTLSFTVTAKDGITKRIYTTIPVEKIIETYTKASVLFDKDATAAGIGSSVEFNMIGVSGNHLAIGTKVFDRKTMAAVGTLDMTGYDGLKIAWLSNDEAGILVASLTADGDRETAPATICCWKNGYDQPAETLLGPSDSKIAGFLSVSGNLTEGKALITAFGGGGADGAHFCWEFTDGVQTNYYPNLKTGHPSNDGSWTQQVSACTGDVSGTWFMWDAIAGGSDVHTWSGWNGESTISLTPVTGVIPMGPASWGNYTRGSIRSFVFNNTSCAAVFTTGWAACYVSIVDGSGEYLLNPNDAESTWEANENLPVGTFIYDPEDNCGYMYALLPGYFVKCWKLEIAIL